MFIKRKRIHPQRVGESVISIKNLNLEHSKSKNASYKSRIKETENSVYTLDIDFTNKNIQMVDKHMIWYSTSLILRKLK